ncbi:MAG: hypothetical protein K1X64_20575 [Myxococcaceae bacterium]|nr:hypothetical protein [Myxococcaceae bacterium]
MGRLTNACAILALFVGCGGHFANGVYTKGHLRYRVGVLSDQWKQLKLDDNDLAFVATDSPHAVAVNATCEAYEDASLKVLTRHLMMGFTQPETLSQESVPLDGREALRTHVTALMDGVPVELVLVVLKKDNCVYDFTYLSPVGRLADRESEFDRLVAAFSTEP